MQGSYKVIYKASQFEPACKSILDISQSILKHKTLLEVPIKELIEMFRYCA